MTVEPGYGGQTLIPTSAARVRQVRALFGEEVDIEVDGGINDTTIIEMAQAGANIFVVGSFIFGATDRRARIARLRRSPARRITEGI